MAEIVQNIRLMIILLGVVGLLLVWVGTLIWRRRIENEQRRHFQAQAGQFRDPERPAGFGYKMAWMVIRGHAPEAIAAELFPSNPQERRACWAEGLETAHGDDERWVFITPAVDGWVFVVGWWAWPNEPSKLERRLLQLSERFGECQAYMSMRVSSCYGWARAANGSMLRYFEVADGEIFQDSGESTDAEAQAGITREHPDWHLEIDEEDVLAIAAIWSMNPTTLNDRNAPDSYGLICSTEPEKPN